MNLEADVDGSTLAIRTIREKDVIPDVSSEWDAWDSGDMLPGPHERAVVTLDGEVIGTVSWHAVTYGPTVGSRAWSMGIALAPRWRRKGWGTEAQALLAEHLLLTAHRVEASTDVDNLAEQRSLTKAGFTREGVLRGAQMRADGRHHDLVVYSRVRADAAEGRGSVDPER